MLSMEEGHPGPSRSSYAIQGRPGPSQGWPPSKADSRNRNRMTIVVAFTQVPPEAEPEARIREQEV